MHSGSVLRSSSWDAWGRLAPCGGFSALFTLDVVLHIVPDITYKQKELCPLLGCLVLFIFCLRLFPLPCD